jgi:hypothetical protein
VIFLIIDPKEGYKTIIHLKCQNDLASKFTVSIKPEEESISK